MSFIWDNYLQLALQLVSSPLSCTQEAKFRCATSRAYYAAFCSARNILRDKDGSTLPRTDLHKHVIETFEQSSDFRRRKIGTDLRRMRTLRNHADYDDVVSNLTSEWSDCSSRARRVITALQIV